MVIYNDEQEYIMSEFIKFMRDPNEQIFQYSGGPGTGKTTILLEMLRRARVDLKRSAPMAYIGQAAINMRMNGLTNAKTIHSWIYEPANVLKVDSYGNVIMDTYLNRPKLGMSFVPKPFLQDIDLIIVDEGGSVPYSLKHDIEKHGIKILVTGDLDQLPPVGDKPAYLYEGKVYRLTQIMRQKEGSNIVQLCHRAKLGLPIHNGFYGDVLVIDYDELTDDMILSSEVIICGKNETRDMLNKYVRKELLKIDYDLPMRGERVICRKNNWSIEVDGINLANGLVGTVMNQPGVHGFNGENFIIDFLPNNLNTTFRSIECDYQYFISEHSRRQELKLNKYNQGEKFEFAYATTCHLSQGSQYRKGIYIEEYLNPQIQNNLNYTGLSRFRDMCIYVKKRKSFF